MKTSPGINVIVEPFNEHRAPHYLPSEVWDLLTSGTYDNQVLRVYELTISFVRETMGFAYDFNRMSKEAKRRGIHLVLEFYGDQETARELLGWLPVQQLVFSRGG